MCFVGVRPRNGLAYSESSGGLIPTYEKSVIYSEQSEESNTENLSDPSLHSE